MCIIRDDQLFYAKKKEKKKSTESEQKMAFSYLFQAADS